MHRQETEHDLTVNETNSNKSFSHQWDHPPKAYMSIYMFAALSKSVAHYIAPRQLFPLAAIVLRLQNSSAETSGWCQGGFVKFWYCQCLHHTASPERVSWQLSTAGKTETQPRCLIQRHSKNQQNITLIMHLNMMSILTDVLKRLKKATFAFR